MGQYFRVWPLSIVIDLRVYSLITFAIKPKNIDVTRTLNGKLKTILSIFNIDKESFFHCMHLQLHKNHLIGLYYKMGTLFKVSLESTCFEIL